MFFKPMKDAVKKEDKKMSLHCHNGEGKGGVLTILNLRILLGSVSFRWGCLKARGTSDIELLRSC